MKTPNNEVLSRAEFALKTEIDSLVSKRIGPLVEAMERVSRAIDLLTAEKNSALKIFEGF